ncbi:hypothetical protein L1987_62790 [Smallanthus sonchifolius]|uniref:Uncharacterized protein n=1 Tax=Smallanthus sonchifolius TaxID=185202 RepID=A0ACB9CBH2_9ASTR|nr:hypothetical protein L1987_62790 [Smallanthus sonchifolius]
MERSKHLHNFNLPQGLSWGRRNLLRYMDVNPVRAIPEVDDDESSDSGKYNQNRSIDKSCAEMEGIEIKGEESSPPLDSKSKQKLKAKTSPPLKICSEGGADRGINADAEDLWAEKIRPRRNLDKMDERPKFSIALSRKEIEEDFIALTGKKPPRKSNKLSKSVQMKLDAVTPGLWLSEVHLDRYKVDENGKI